ncbi:MobF family relaxase [Ferrimicrobium sp.]|uniref:MobF family relaxase n=1 Tax=Ferrimicrobium sp. TaxID=2926050 RepID=UPI00260416A8|nr:MobF family relaxase [Ferrimicrobium sp.]
MRLFKIRGSLDYYVQRELCDEVGVVSRLGMGCQPDAPVDLVDLGSAATTIRHPIKALDFTIAAPKAVSVRWALAPEAERIQIEAAHHVAVRRTFAVISEFDAAKTIHGVIRPVEGVVAYDVGHRLSRAGDPHLHSHLVVLNHADVDGRRVALEHAHWARGLPVWELCYRTELAHELEAFGITLIGQGLGSWRVTGQAVGLNAVFSKRRHEVIRFSGDHGSGRMRQLAALSTRQDKVPQVQSELRARWESEARSAPLELAVSPVLAGEARAAVRVNDPLLNELVKAIERGATDLLTAKERALRAALGEQRALRLMRGEGIMLGDKRTGLDGSLCQAYRSLPVTERLALMDVPTKHLEEVFASREVIPMVAALEGAGLRPGDRVTVETRTSQEATLVNSFGQYRQSIHGTTLVVDVNALPPSEFGDMVRQGRTVVRSPGTSIHGSGTATMLGLRNDEGKSLVLAESSVALWKAFVADCVDWVRAECKEDVTFAASSPGLSAKLRREVGRQMPEAVVGRVGSRPFFRGEPVAMPDGRGGRIVAAHDRHLEVQIGETIETVPTRGARPVGFSAESNDRRLVVFGPLDGKDVSRIERAYLCQQQLSELVHHLRLNTDGHGVSWLDAQPTSTISLARRVELARTNGRFHGEKLYQLRAVTTTLSSIYDRAEELGFDDRRGRDRIMDEQLGLYRERDALSRGRSR